WGGNHQLVGLLASGARPSILPSPLSELNVLSCDVPEQLHQFIYDIADVLSIRPERPAVYQKAINELVEESRTNRPNLECTFEGNWVVDTISSENGKPAEGTLATIDPNRDGYNLRFWDSASVWPLSGKDGTINGTLGSRSFSLILAPDGKSIEF